MKYIYILLSLFFLFVIQHFISIIFFDTNKNIDDFYNKKLNKCQIINIQKVKFEIGKGDYTEIITDCGNFPILVENYSFSGNIKKGAYVSKKAQNNEFEISNNNNIYSFTITSYKDYENKIRLFAFVASIVVLISTYISLLKLNFFK